MPQPLIDSARLQFSGLSSEDFDDVPEIGEERTYTIIATCQAHNERAMANEGTRKSVQMKVVRVLSGVTKEINKPAEPSLFDGDQSDEVADEPEEEPADEVEPGELDPNEADGDEDQADAEESTNVTRLAGPSFSSTD